VGERSKRRRHPLPMRLSWWSMSVTNSPASSALICVSSTVSSRRDQPRRAYPARYSRSSDRGGTEAAWPIGEATGRAGTVSTLFTHIYPDDPVPIIHFTDAHARLYRTAKATNDRPCRTSAATRRRSGRGRPGKYSVDLGGHDEVVLMQSLWSAERPSRCPNRS
jgi:hypothetical protein